VLPYAAGGLNEKFLFKNIWLMDANLVAPQRE
jgi:hypothetical protein